MRNFSKKIVQSWGKTVHNSCTTHRQTQYLYTGALSPAATYVHKPGSFTSTYTRFVPRIIPAILVLFSSVKSAVIPTIHTPYKENNKSKILNSFFLYTSHVEEI